MCLWNELGICVGCTENVAVEGLSSLEDIPNTSVDELLEKLGVLQVLEMTYPLCISPFYP